MQLQPEHLRLGRDPRPIAAYAYRTIGKGTSTTCREAGTYDVLVERESEDESSPEAWDLELRFVQEPGLRGGGPTETSAPKDWPSTTPAPPDAEAQKRTGGTSYYDATSLETGEWADAIAPGQTRFYRVPVDWGQQIYASAALSNSPGDSSEFIGSALTLSLDNPAQGHVVDTSLSYSGKSATTALKPLPPVEYRNRYDFSSQVGAMRFAGWYYLSVTLSPKVAESYGKDPIALTMTVQVKNDAGASPYEGDPGIFAVTEKDKELAQSGDSAPKAAKSATMQVVAAGALGTGAVLVLGLGGWTLLARRRAAAAAAGGPGDPVGLFRGTSSGLTEGRRSRAGDGVRPDTPAAPAYIWVSAQMPTAKQISATTSTGTATFGGGPGRVCRACRAGADTGVCACAARGWCCWAV